MDSEPLFDPDEGERRKREGMDRADKHADEDWSVVIRRCFFYAARTHPRFTTDLLWALMKRYYPNVETHERRAMGAVIRWAKNEGLIEDTGLTELSKRPEHHRYPCPVYRSLIYNAEQS